MYLGRLMAIMKNLLLLCLCLSLASVVRAQSDFFVDAEKFLDKYTKNGKVFYADIRKNPKDAENLRALIADYVLTGEKTEDLAFFIDAYNILVICSLSDAFPTASPQKISGFFDKNEHRVAGEKMSLNFLENERIRARFRDPRVHFALVCGAKGCPPIRSAYLPRKLEAQLDKATREAMNNDQFIRIDKGSQKITISEIFKWYKEDFGNSDEKLMEFINSYRDLPIPAHYKIWYYTYDWSINSPY